MTEDAPTETGGRAVTEPHTTATVTPVPGTGTLLRILRDGRPRTRSELAVLTGLARSTVTQRVDALLAGGFIGPKIGRAHV